MTTISLDVESTITNILTPFREELKERTGKEIQDRIEWGFKNVDVSKDTFMEITSSNWKHKPLEIPPTEAGIHVPIMAIYDKAEKLDIVTGRQGFDEEIRTWLEYYSIPYDDFVVVQGQEAKADLGYDVLIDDSPKHVDAVSDDQRLILYDQPYNRNIEMQDNFYRATSFGQVERYAFPVEA